MNGTPNYGDGYYWARHPDGTTFIVLREGGHWFVPGIGHSIEFDPRCVIMPVKQPVN